MKKNLNSHKFQLECKDFKVKEMGGDTLVISGYANTTDKDRVGDVIKEEAWTKGGLDNYLKNPIVLAYHDPAQPIGEVVDYGVSNKGLHVIAEIHKAAGNVYELIKAGILKAFSVGFVVKDADYDTETDIFVIKNLELYELSVVSIPANADSIFSVAKSFENEEDYNQFKQLYSNNTEEENTTLDVEDVKTLVKEVLDTKEENKEMDKDTISLTKEELEAKMQEAVQAKLDSIAAEKARKEEIAKIATEVNTSGAERLMKDFEEKYLEKEKSLEESLEGMRAELSEKAAEIEAMTKSKMSFNPVERSNKATQEEIDTAVLAGKITGKSMTDTKYFQNLVTKYGDQANTGDHLADMAIPAEWENLFSTTLYQDIQDKTIIEPLFTNKIQMNSRSMQFPWNPEAGYAQWISDANYKGANSTGTAGEHKPTDNFIVAEKMATKEYLGYEEEEDAIIPLVPMIRSAIERRMVRSTDQELLLGDKGVTINSGVGLIDGLTYAAKTLNGGADYQYTQPGAFGDPVTIADMQQTRRLMGTFGLMPGELTYVVSQTVMYDLMEDPDFRTMDLVGDRATILRGQIGSINGSPVVISDSFVPYATGTIQAVAMSTRNHLFGTLRGMMVERDKDIETQTHVLVATRRFGLTEIIPTKTKAAYAALNTQPRCPVANFVTA